MAKEVETVDTTTGEVVPAGRQIDLSPQVVNQFVEMVRLIPQDDGAAMDRIAAQILNSTSWDELDSPWTTDKVDHLIDREQKIIGLNVQPSGYDGGLPFFLVVDSFDLEKGEDLTWTTGSVAMCMQLAKAYHAGWLPLKAKIVRAARPSRNGYYPQHLQVLDIYQTIE